MRHVRKLMFLAATLAALASCVVGRNKTVATFEHRAAPERRSDTAIILLPGFGDDPDEFVANGFVEAVREAGIAADIIAADAYASYYFGGTAQERLYKDVVTPTKQAGYARIWLVGVSMGGFGALWTAQRDPTPITGIVLFAPYGGRNRVLKKIAAVGVEAWQPGADTGTWDHELWRWLKTSGAQDSTVPPIWLAFGKDDTGYATTLLQQIVPKDHVYTRPGGHDWDVWAPLWKTMLPAIPWTGELVTAASPTGAGARTAAELDTMCRADGFDFAYGLTHERVGSFLECGRGPGTVCGADSPRRCEGTSLLMCERGRLSAQDCAVYCTEIADANGRLHERGACDVANGRPGCLCSGPIAPRAVVPMAAAVK